MELGSKETRNREFIPLKISKDFFVDSYTTNYAKHKLVSNSLQIQIK